MKAGETFPVRGRVARVLSGPRQHAILDAQRNLDVADEHKAREACQKIVRMLWLKRLCDIFFYGGDGVQRLHAFATLALCHLADHGRQSIAVLPGVRADAVRARLKRLSPNGKAALRSWAAGQYEPAAGACQAAGGAYTRGADEPDAKTRALFRDAARQACERACLAAPFYRQSATTCSALRQRVAR